MLKCEKMTYVLLMQINHMAFHNNGFFTLHGNGTGTGTGNWNSTTGTNWSWFLSLSWISVNISVQYILGSIAPGPEPCTVNNGVFTLSDTDTDTNRQIPRPIKMAYIELHEGVHTAPRPYQ